MEPLSYSSLPNRIPRVMKWFAALPPWATVLGMGLMVWTLNFVDIGWPLGQWQHNIQKALRIAVLFLPGALQRLNRRQILIMLGCAAAWFGVNEIFPDLFHGVRFPYGYAMSMALPPLVAGVAECLVTERKATRSLIWVFAFSIGIGCLITLLTAPLNFRPQVSIQFSRNGPTRFFALGSLIFWPVLLTLTWAVLPLAARITSPRRWVLSLASVILCLAAYQFYFSVMIYSTAQRSLEPGGSFTKSSAIWLLFHRGNAEDRKAIWSILETADWSNLPGVSMEPDYRKYCVDALTVWNRNETATRLADLLERKPTEALASFSASLLAEGQRYEAVPILTRYALRGQHESEAALETMKIPQAMLAIIREEYASRNLQTSARPGALSADVRGRLRRLLGRDAGVRLKDWSSAYDSSQLQYPDGMSKKVVDETNRVVAAIAEYSLARSRRYDAERRLFMQRLKRDGYGAQFEKLTAIASRKDRKGFEAALDADHNTAYIIEKYDDQAISDMTVADVDWDVVGTIGLEREVSAYIGRVDAAIATYGLSATKPSTAPTQPAESQDARKAE